ncbi:hypothetical protein [Pontibacter virosus]|uniref:Uncharacterized protein n=1 Tax=Pontibacter virosus TaxID=1765052 RepID=A0A2U1B3G6_9BACT|nr:hypothetical protein [Pontibacter virosus]PVY43142.1 hypothetical protein C8E01_102319 [Pontibacter virosus]
MSELTAFISKLDTCDCDLIVLTFIGEERLYCRFFKGGLYKDRMFINDEAVMAKLCAVCGEGEEIDAAGIKKLREMFSPSQANDPASI